MPLSREETMVLGGKIASQTLTEWSGAMHAIAAKKENAPRLTKRGVAPAFLEEILKLTTSVPKLETTQEVGKKDGPVSTESVERIMDDGFDWRREVLESVKVEFGTDPDRMARFRTGVHVGGSTSLLVREIRFLVPVLRDYAAQLAWLGLNAAFLERGTMLADAIEAANTEQEATVKALPPKTAELYLAKGQLYDLTRKLVRLGRLEFRKEPELARQFTYEIVRRVQVAARAARARAAAAAAAPAAKPAK